MANLGLVSGERVAILALTGPDFFVAFVGTLCAGGVPVPIYRAGATRRIGQLRRA